MSGRERSRSPAPLREPVGPNFESLLTDTFASLGLSDAKLDHFLYVGAKEWVDCPKFWLVEIHEKDNLGIMAEKFDVDVDLLSIIRNRLVTMQGFNSWYAEYLQTMEDLNNENREENLCCVCLEDLDRPISQCHGHRVQCRQCRKEFHALCVHTLEPCPACRFYPL